TNAISAIIIVGAMLAAGLTQTGLGRTLDGGGMAVFQAVGAFELFTGIAPNAHRMLAHFAALQDAEATAHAGATDPQGVARPGIGLAAVALGR
ncbi:hypothetical protein ACQCR9_21995, partial [Ralstonia pseudosolanacearum]